MSISDSRLVSEHQDRGGARTLPYSAALFLILSAYHALLYFLWSAYKPIYFGWMHILGVNAWKAPFLDLLGVLSWGDCHAAGINVMQINPCDPLNRLLAYSPLLLNFHLNWIGRAHLTAASIVIDWVFLAALTIVLRPKSVGGLAIAFLACLSPAVLFAIERANLDVFVFTLLTVAAFLSLRDAPARALSYIIAISAGLLKFYPFVALTLMARERLRAALAYGCLAAAVIGWFAVHYWRELIGLSGTYLGPAPLGGRFGAMELPFLTARFLGLPHGSRWLLYALLLAILAYVIMRLARRLGPALPLDWRSTDHFLLALGSIVVVGCFFAGLSNGYRASLLVFVIPGLLALKASVKDRGARRIVITTLVLTLCCLWQLFLERGLIDLITFAAIPYGGHIYVLLREIVWWVLMSVLASFVLLFVAQSSAWTDLLSLLKNRRSA